MFNAESGAFVREPSRTEIRNRKYAKASKARGSQAVPATYAIAIGKIKLEERANSPGHAARKAFLWCLKTGQIKRQPASDGEGGWFGVKVVRAGETASQLARPKKMPKLGRDVNAQPKDREPKLAAPSLEPTRRSRKPSSVPHEEQPKVVRHVKKKRGRPKAPIKGQPVVTMTPRTKPKVEHRKQNFEIAKATGLRKLARKDREEWGKLAREAQRPVVAAAEHAPIQVPPKSKKPGPRRKYLDGKAVPQIPGARRFVPLNKRGGSKAA